MEYKGFTIVDCGWGYHVYGTSANTIKYGFVRNFETIQEAIDYIDKLERLKMPFFFMLKYCNHFVTIITKL